MDPALAGAGRRDAPRAPAGTADSGPPDCPFCPGGEDRLGRIVAELPAAASPGWAARAVTNRFPFLRGGEGVQEVLVDTPRHGATLAGMGVDERRAALGLYRDRLRAHGTGDPGSEPAGELHLFRNQGRAAGSSRSHPHGQLVVLRGRSPHRQALEARLVTLHGALGGCGLCAATGEHTPEPARRDEDGRARGLHGLRGLHGHPVHQGPHFTVHVLHAPRDPCHLRIIPRAHAPSMARATDEALDALAHLLGPLSAAVSRQVGHEEHNLLFHDHGLSGGRGPAPGAPSPVALHWHLEYRPRVTRTAGFEQMAGVGVCPSEPAADARALRDLLPGLLRPPAVG